MRPERSLHVVRLTIVPFPKPSGKPNKKRRLNMLLRHQVRRLREIELRHIPQHHTGFGPELAKMNEAQAEEYIRERMTEGEAAEYIRLMTAKLHELKETPKSKRRTKAKTRKSSPSKRAKKTSRKRK